MSTIHILLVESDAEYSRVAKQTLEASELLCVVHVAPLLAQALKTLKRRWFNLILLNPDLPDSSGVATLEALISAFPRTSIVALVSSEDEQTKEGLLKGGVQACLNKSSLGKQQLVEAVKNMAKMPSLGSPHFKQQQANSSKRRPKR